MLASNPSGISGTLWRMASPFVGLTRRGRALRQWSRLRKRNNITEQPANSNCDKRKYGIRWLQDKCAGSGTWLRNQPWCGCFVFIGLWRAKVKGISYRQASVALIEQDARAGRGPFTRWREPSEWRRVLRGDAVVLFGYGVHVEGVRGFRKIAGRVYVITEGGNTSPQGGGGSQSNGGGAYKRIRPLSDVRGFAIVRYRSRRNRVAEGFDRLRTRTTRITGPELATLEQEQSEDRTASDALLYDGLSRSGGNPFLARALFALGWGDGEQAVPEGERGA